MKLILRNALLRLADLLSSDLLDSVNGKKLGRGLVVAWGGRIILIGYRGQALVPHFLPQQRLTYWNQQLGFTALPAPDFESLQYASSEASGDLQQNDKVLNILLAHQGGDAFQRLLEWWKPVCPPEFLWVAFGGTREAFEQLEYPRKVYIDDPKLRTRDHQREKQSYTAIFNAMASIVQLEAPDYVYLCEYDQLPLVKDLNRRQIETLINEKADIMGHHLVTISRTGHAHQLYHESDPVYLSFWQSVSKRNSSPVIFSMFGSGSFWTRAAFLAVAAEKQTIDCYLEIYLPTLAHHLGFRVRCWDEKQHLISNLPSPSVTVEEAKKLNCWTVHPIKEIGPTT